MSSSGDQRLDGYQPGRRVRVGLEIEVTPIGVIRRARSFGRNHRRPQRMLWRAGLSKRRTIVRLLEPFEDLPADADRGLLSLDAGDGKPGLGVQAAILGTEAESTHRNHSDPAPFPVTDLEDILHQRPRRGVTLGADGCLIATAQELVHVPAFKVDVVDTTGAGDAFMGGLSYALLQNWDLKRVGSFANACAALCCTKVGARAMSKYSEVTAFIERSQAKSGTA